MATPTGKRAIYYFTSWCGYAPNYHVKDIPTEASDIAYAFWNVLPDGSVVTGDAWADVDKRFTETGDLLPLDTWSENPVDRFYGNFSQFQKLQQSGRAINVTLSIGGWTWSKNFSPAVSTVETRANMARHLIDIFQKYPIFSGVSIDWEYVSNDGINYGNKGNLATPQDSANLLEFLRVLRQQLQKANMENYTVSMCVSADPQKAKFDLEKMHPLLDEIHVMTYDFADGNWNGTTAVHHTNPRKSKFSKYSTEVSVDYFLSRGVPSQKLFIGVAFYSRGFSNTDGFGKSALGGSQDRSWENGMVDYKSLPLAGATEYFDMECKGAYSYDPVKRIVNTYDNPESVVEKCKMVFEKDLGGVLVWELSADRPIKDSRSLVRVLRENLTHGKPQHVKQEVKNEEKQEVKNEEKHEEVKQEVKQDVKQEVKHEEKQEVKPETGFCNCCCNLPKPTQRPSVNKKSNAKKRKGKKVGPKK
jgi:chitinase